MSTPEQRAERAAYMREYRMKNPQQRKADAEQVARWYRDNPSKRKWINRSHQQRKAGLFITRQQELAIYEASDGLCALCYEEPATVIDHDHDTGQPRGALCHSCNKGIGFLKDSVDRLKLAIEYLENEPILVSM